MIEQEKISCNNLIVVEEHKIDNRITSCLINDNQKKYFAIIGLDDHINLNVNGLIPCEVSREFFFRIICDLDIELKNNINPYFIENEILFYGQSDSNYDGHGYEVVLNYFPKIYLFELDSAYEKISRLSLCNIVGYFLCENREYLSLDFNDNVLDKIGEIFLNDFKSLNYNTLLRSIVNIYYKDCFMDIYRCIEYIYRVYELNEIHQELETTLTLEEVYEQLITKFSYKFVEISSIKRIFENASESIKTNLCGIDGELFEKGKEYNGFYKVRNSLVHGRSKDKEIDLHDEKWILLIETSLMLLEHVHDYVKSKNIAIDFLAKTQKS